MIGFCLPNAKAGSVLPELAAIGCFLILPWIGVTAGRRGEHDSAEAMSMQANGNLSQALYQSTRQTIGQSDYILLSARALHAARGD